MANSLLLSVFIVILALLYSANSTAIANSNDTSSSCPMDLSYVESFPWYTQECQAGGDTKTCCQTLRSLLGMGLSIYLKNSSNFYVSTPELASSCLSLFQSKLDSLSINLPLVPTCFNSSNELLNQPTSCAGIRSLKDWSQKLGPTPQLESSCKGDMSRLTQCSACLDAGMKVTSELVSLSPNSTKCFYFTIFYAAGIVNQFGAVDPRAAACILGLPLASNLNCDHSPSKSSTKTAVMLVFGLLGALMLLLGIVCLYRIWDKRRKEKEFVSSVRSQVSPNAGAIWYRGSELEKATNGFCSKNLIGQGGYGVVYRGTFSNGCTVAIKQTSDGDGDGDDVGSMRDEEFCNEVEIISKIRHRNLVPLKGCCITKGKTRYVVYDYMPNGSLRDHLFSPCPSHRLRWPQRKNILIDIAKGLSYLHYGVKPPIYHRDIKSANILLDSEMRARVGDFGMAKQSRQGKSHLTTRVAGTQGYLAPEYALYGQFTEKSDVYSFGIVILETMSGRRVLDMSKSNASCSPLIADFAWDLVKSGNVFAFLDETIRDEGPKGIMERFVRVGILCAHLILAFRPTVPQALKMLEGDIDIPELPNRPLPLTSPSLLNNFFPFSLIPNS